MQSEWAAVKAGDRVRCIREVQFCDGTKHEYGQIITLRAETEAYYHHALNNVNYVLIRENLLNIRLVRVAEDGESSWTLAAPRPAGRFYFSADLQRAELVELMRLFELHALEQSMASAQL